MNRHLVSIPNLITLGRLLCVPAAIYFVAVEALDWAFWIFVVAAVSDAVDGFIARAFKAKSVVGAYLDPLADKALLVSLFVMLGLKDYIPIWLVILAVSRDVMIVGGILLFQMLRQTVAIRPLFISKFNTAAQLGLIVLVLAVEGLALNDFGFVEILVYVVAITTVLSGAAYIVQGSRRLAGIETTE